VLQAFGPYACRTEVNFQAATRMPLFGIYGPTGSGKTSILDAICFALFAESSGGERLGVDLRSSYSDDNIETYVELLFMLGDNCYLIHRKPEQTIAKKRGDGTVKRRHEAHLFRVLPEEIATASYPDNPGEVIAERKVEDVGKAVGDLLGYSASQFRQVVVLPQGRFRELLTANSKSRSTILRRLFPSLLYERITSKLQDRKHSITIELRKLQTAMDTLIEVEEKVFLEGTEQLKQELADMAKAISGLQSRHKTATELLATGKEQSKLFSELDAAKALLAEMQQKNASMRKLEKQKNAAIAAAKLQPLADKYSEIKQAVQAAMAVERKQTSILSDIKKQLQEAYHHRQQTAENMENNSILQSIQQLASGLVEGAPCPVCGSTEHPAPASKYKKTALETKSLSLENFGEKLEAMRKEHAVAERKYQQLNDAHTQATALVTHAATEVEKIRRQSVEIAENFHQKLTVAGFANATEYKQAVRTDLAVEDMQKRLHEFAVNLRSARNLVGRAEAGIKIKQRPDLEVMQLRVEDYQQKLVEANRKETRISETVRQRSKAYEKYCKLKRQYEDLEQNYRTIAELAAVAAGEGGNTRKIRLIDWVLTVYFEDILTQANIRLEKMSQGRFILKRQQLPSSGRGVHGLEITVLDTFTGTERRATTLSGGESFQAALCLALGLSEVAQSESGGVHLDTIFIDEGFGNLDEEALVQALETIIDLQGSTSRTVGIISHVEEVKRLVPLGFNIKSSRHGSKITAQTVQ
jgi:exonuclease SbcC